MFAMLGLLSGCGPKPVSTSATIHFETSTPEEMALAGSILKARFDELTPTYFSSFTVVVHEKDIVLEFRGVAPADEVIREYASQGIFRIYAADSRLIWLVTDRDVQRVNALASENGFVLDMSVNESAGQRLQTYTSRNVGRVLVTSWNGKEQSRATVQGVFSRQFQTTGLDRETALRMRIMLESGRLPMAVREIDLVHPASATG